MAPDPKTSFPTGTNGALLGVSFADRFAAKLVDGLILLVPYLMLHFSTIPFLGPIFLSFLYYTFFESSAAQATPGKRLAGIKVISLNGSPITFTAACVRMVFRFLSTTLCFLPYLAVFFTRHRQAAHDLISETLVVSGKNDEPLIEAWLHSFKNFIYDVQRRFQKAK